MWEVILSFGATVFILLYFCTQAYKRHGKVNVQPAKTMVVLGSGSSLSVCHKVGGHTSEAIALLRSLDPSLYSPLVLVCADTDTKSISKFRSENVLLSVKLHPATF